MSEQHNYRVLTPVGWFTCDTQERLEEEIKHCTEDVLAEFYQPGIGWVKYTPQPVDYAAIIRQLVAAGDQAAISGEDEEFANWLEARNSAEVKKVLGET
jgi:hypothetical protein